MRKYGIVLTAAVILCALNSGAAPEDTLKVEAEGQLRRAVTFFREQVSV